MGGREGEVFQTAQVSGPGKWGKEKGERAGRDAVQEMDPGNASAPLLPGEESAPARSDVTQETETVHVESGEGFRKEAESRQVRQGGQQRLPAAGEERGHRGDGHVNQT